MKKLLASLLVSLASLVANAQELDYSKFKLAWADEFNEERLDITKWKLDREGKRHEAINTLDVVSICDGKMVISPYTKDGVHYTAVMSNEHAYQNAYGYWEMRARIKSAPGTWHAFWLYNRGMEKPSNNNYYYDGLELDIFEHRSQDNEGNDISKRLHYTMHYNGYGRDHSGYGFETKDIADFENEFNVFGVLWEDQKYSFYLNGKLIYEFWGVVTPQKAFVLISTEIGSDVWAGKAKKEYKKGDVFFEVDYVRHYELIK